MEKEKIGELYKKQYRTVYFYTLSLCKNKELAEDIVSRAFEKAMLSLNSSVKNYTHWLMRVSRNIWIDWLRKESRISHVPLEDLKLETGEKDIADELGEGEENIKLYRAVEGLPGSDKEIIILYYFSEIGVRQIAETMSMSESNVKIRLHRARLKMKTNMEMKEKTEAGR